MQIIKATTQDNLIFSGLLSVPQDPTKKIIIHIHGMAGDIYTNSFYPSMYKDYAESGIAFLAVQNRGTNTVTEFNTASGDIKVLGNAYEKFEDCLLDIEAWVNKAIELGYEEIWLQGHSLGTSKIAYYAANSNANISGLILLSPSDMIGLVYDPVGYEDHKVLLPEAKQLVSEGKGSQLLRSNLWGSNKLSADTYLNFFDEGSNTAIFNYGKPELGWDVVNKLSIPVIGFTGTKDDGVIPCMNAFAAMTLLEKQLINSPRKQTIIYEDAEHDFKGFGDEIVQSVIDFIK